MYVSQATCVSVPLVEAFTVTVANVVISKLQLPPLVKIGPTTQFGLFTTVPGYAFPVTELAATVPDPSVN